MERGCGRERVKGGSNREWREGVKGGSQERVWRGPVGRPPNDGLRLTERRLATTAHVIPRRCANASRRGAVVARVVKTGAARVMEMEDGGWRYLGR